MNETEQECIILDAVYGDDRRHGQLGRVWEARGEPMPVS
jgi:hypothetical protein